MIKKITLLFILVAQGLTAYADDASNSKAAELSLHRLERLVILKKVPASFQLNVNGLSLSKLVQVQPTDPVFESVISQVPAQDASQLKVHVFMDTTAKALSFTQDQGGESLHAPVWPITDSVTLLEYSLHCLQGELIGTSDLCQKNPDLADFERNFSAAILTQLTVDSAVTAVVTISKTTSSSKAIIRFNSDGSLTANTPIEIIP